MWKIFAVVVTVTLATVSASPVNTCVLQKDTAMEQFKLSNLNRLIGEILTTESNGNIYLVSICRPISKLFYDPRKLAGALKMTSDGDTIDLGRIDQTDVVVNEDTIVLTYVGGDINMNSKDTCKGQRWTTYMTFICDPLASSDVLTLIDEDPDQPEICQVWFEIKTSKTCVRQPQVPLNVLENYFIEHNKAIENKINTEKNSTHNEKNESITSKYPVNEGNNSNHNYSHNSSTELPVPFINIHPNATNDIKHINNEYKENNDELHHDKSNKSSSIENNDFIKERKSTNEEMKNRNSTQINSNENKEDNLNKNTHAEKSSIKENNNSRTNLNPSYKENKTNPQNNNTVDGLHKSQNDNSSKENKLNNNENKEDNLNKNTHEEKSSNKENNNSSMNINLSDQKNNINHQNNNSDDILNTKENYISVKEHESGNNKKKDVNLNKNIHEEKSSNKENNNFEMNKNESENKNKEIPLNAHSKDILSKNESDNYGKEIKSRNYENISSNKNTSEGNSFNNEKSYPGKYGNRTNHNSLHPKNSKTETSHNKNDNTGNDNKSTNYADKEDDLNKNTTRDNSSNNQNTNFKTNKNPSENENSQNNDTEYKSSRNENNSIGNIDNKEDNLNKNAIKNDSKIDDGKFPGKGMAKDKNSSGDYKKYLDKNNNTIYDINKSNNSLLNNILYNNPEKTPSENEDKSSNDTNKADNSNQNYSKNNNNNTIRNSDNTIDNTTAVIVKLPKNNLSNMTINDDANQSSEIKHSSTEKTTTGSINNDNSINDNTELNSTIKNNVNKNVQTDSYSTPESNSIPPDSSTRPNTFDNNDNNNNNNSNTTAGGTNQSGDDLNFSNLFKKLFPNGIQLSATSITGGLGVLMSIYVAVGTAINRYYYKKTGTDQIPLKGAFQSIKGFITNTFGCCIGNLEAQDVSNEKSPLLSPKFVNETSRRSSSDESNQGKGGNYNNDTNSDQNNKKGYGSMTNEKDSPTTEKNIRKQSSSKKSSLESGKEELFNTMHELQGKSIKEVINDKISTIVPTIKNFFATFGKKLIKSEYEEIKKNVETMSDTPSSLISELIGEEKSLSKKNDVRVNEEIKAKKSESHLKTDENLKQSSNVETNIENEIHNDVVEIQSGINFNNVEKSPPQKDNSDDLKGELISKLVEELDDINFELNIEPNKINSEGEIIKKTNNTNESDQKTVENKHNVLNTLNILESTTNEIFDSTKPSSNSALLVKEIAKNNEEKETLNKSSDLKTKTQESKLKFLGLSSEDEKEDDKKVQKELTNKLNVSKNNIKADDDEELIETIEEVVYIDGTGSDNEEEEIIEITETTTVEESPEKLDEFNFKNGELSPHSEPHKEVSTVTTVKKTIRKPSSSSSPEEVIISEETMASRGTPDSNKKPFGFQFGIGKSGVNMSVGEKQVGIGKSGMKFGKRDDQESDTNKDGQMTLKLDKSGFKLNRNKNKSQKDGVSDEHAAGVTVSELEKRDTISPEKEKKSKTLPNFKMFKRSVSHPVVSNAQEVVDESSSSGVSKKSFRGSAGLLKFGKSRSKSTGVMDMDDIITTDVNVMSSFIDHERYASNQSLTDLSKVEKTADGNGTVHLIPNENVSSQDFLSGEKSHSQPLKVVDEVQSSVGTSNTDLKIGLPEVEKNEYRKPIKNIKKPGKKSPGVAIKRGKK